jgi:hypothetical protein
MSKGPRVDEISFLVSPGDTVKIYVDKNRWKEMTRSGEVADHLLPSDGSITVIPAFSLVEMTIASKNSDAANDKGSCINVMKIRPLPSDVSVHSVAGFLHHLPSSLNDALLAASTKAISSPFIGSDLVKDAVSFFRKTCAVDTACDIVDVADKSGNISKAVRLSQWSTSPCENINSIDILEDVCLAACNTPRLDHAVAMIQIAFAMSAVSIFVTHDAFLSKNGASCLRAMPFISVGTMFANMKFSPEKTPLLDDTRMIQVDSGSTYHDGDGDGVQPILFSLSIDPTIVENLSSTESRPSLDFPFMMGYKSSKFYTVTATFAEKAPKEEVKGVLVFNVDVAKRSASSTLNRGGSVVKRKLSAMKWS